MTTGRHQIKTMCPMNCHPTQCGMLVEVKQQRVMSIKGDPENPDSRGFLCSSTKLGGKPAGLLPVSPLSLADWDALGVDFVRATGHLFMPMYKRLSSVHPAPISPIIWPQSPEP